MTFCANVLIADLTGEGEAILKALPPGRRNVNIARSADIAGNMLRVENPDVLLIVANKENAARAAGLVSIAVDQSYAGQARVVLCAGAGDSGNAHDATRLGALSCGNAGPAVLARRVRDLGRIVTMQQELMVRLVTNENFGIDQIPFDPAVAPKPMANRIIALGFPKDDAALAGLAALGEVVELTAPAAALSHIQMEDCNLVIVGPQLGTAEVTHFIQDLRHFPNRYHLPVVWAHHAELKPKLDELGGIGLVETAPSGEGDKDGALFERVHFLLQVDARRRALQVRYRAVPSTQIRDSLTGLYGHGYFHGHLSDQIVRAEERGVPLSVAVFHVENLEEVNKVSGYPIGDKILGQVGSLIGCLVRTEDTAARIKGASFAVSLPNTTAAEAKRVLERVASVVKFTTLGAFEGAAPSLGIGFGCTDFEPGDTAAALIKRAGQDMSGDNQLAGSFD